MKRNVSLWEISDGRLYGAGDMVRADCGGCKGCYQCCTGMGNSVILDPYDVYRLKQGLGKDMGELLEDGSVELNVVDGVILPNLRMSGQEERCTFLDIEGRCSIHRFRPGLCRLFPLGRYYENGDFRYFLQVDECREKNRSKIKVSKWIDMPDQGRYHDFVCRWHYFLNELEESVKGIEDSDHAKKVNMHLLQLFFLMPYDGGRDFYEQFDGRMNGWMGVKPRENRLKPHK